MRILVTEYFLSTFEKSEDLNFLIEGYAMTRTIIESLSSNAHLIMTILSEKLRDYVELPKVEIIEVKKENYYNTIEKLSKMCDLIIAIAPPNELIKLIDIAECEYVGPSRDLVKLFSDKYSCITKLQELGFKVPKTMKLRRIEDIKRFNNKTHIIKPVDSAGCCGQVVIKSIWEVEKALNYALRYSSRDYVILQEYIEGIPSSISVISNGSDVLLMSLNLQLIHLNNNLEYFGGILPIRKYVDIAFNLVIDLIRKFRGLKGYFGIDVVLRNDDIYIIEINPRLTTSIVGLYRLVNDVGELIVNSISKKELSAKSLPENLHTYYIVTDNLEQIHSNEYLFKLRSVKRCLVSGVFRNYDVDKVISRLLNVNSKIRSYVEIIEKLLKV